MKANFNFKSCVGNPTTARYSTVQYKGKMLILNILNAKPFFLGHSQSENQTCFENGMARALKGRVYKFENVMGSWWKSHVFKSLLENMTFSSWPNDFYQFVHPCFESPCPAVFGSCLVFTVDKTKKIAAYLNKKCVKT